jgi:hypothetical protein
MVPGDYSNAPTDMEEEQAKRRKHLRELVDTFHRSHHGDYDDRYDEFAATYLPEHTEADMTGDVPEDGEVQPIPPYASCAEDETYGMIQVFDTLNEALADQGGISSSGETLNVPAGVYNLDTGEPIETCNVTMTTEAFIVLCGLVQPSNEVNAQGIYSEAWDELRHAFPIEHFKKVAGERGEDFYYKDGGL